MGILEKIKTEMEHIRCTMKISKLFRKHDIHYKDDNKKIIDFFSDYEFLRKKWIEVLSPLNTKERISLFSILYYLLKIQFDGNDYYWSKDKTEMDGEEWDYWTRVSDLLEKPIEIYLEMILENEFKDYKGDVYFEFNKHLNHLENINFSNLVISENFKNLIPKYLLIFFKSDKFDKVEINEDTVLEDEKGGIVKINEIENQIEDIILSSTDIGLNFDKKQFYLLDLKSFVDLSLRKCYDNNELLSMRSRFLHLQN
jgi:hypothetical protein